MIFYATPPPKKWMEDEQVVFMYFLPTGLAPNTCLHTWLYEPPDSVLLFER